LLRLTQCAPEYSSYRFAQFQAKFLLTQRVFAWWHIWPPILNILAILASKLFSKKLSLEKTLLLSFSSSNIFSISDSLRFSAIAAATKLPPLLADTRSNSAKTSCPVGSGLLKVSAKSLRRQFYLDKRPGTTAIERQYPVSFSIWHEE
jgi:hypothetical protein